MIRIIVSNPENPIPDIYKDADGQVSLDIFDSTKIAITKIIDDFIEAGAIKQDNFKEIQLPISKKNRLIFGNVGNPSAYNQNHGKIFDIQLLKNDDYAYPVQGLQVFDISDQGNSYSCTIFGELNDWYRPLSNLYLNELELGSAVVDYDFLVNDLNNDEKYIDGGYPVRAPLVNYGKWYVNNNKSDNSEAQAQVVYNNYRFWYCAKAILEQAFCQVGYSLVAPFMETDTFRQLLTYVLDADFETANQLDVANRPFEAERTTDLDFFILFDKSPAGKHLIGVANMGTPAVSDPGGHYFTRPSGGGFPDEDFYGSFYSGGIIGNFSFNGNVNFTPTNAPSLFSPVSSNYITLNISIRKANKFGIESQEELIENSTILVQRNYIDKNAFINGSVIDYPFDLQTGDIKVYQHEVVFIFIQLKADIVELSSGTLYDESYLYPDMKLDAGANFKNTVKKQVIEEGDTLEFGKMLMKKRTAAEYFKGIAHLYNFKIETDSIGKKVYMYPEFKTDLNSDGVQEGFFLPNQDNPLEATQKIQANSLIEKPKPIELGRDVYLKFADSSDGYISSLNLTDELHSKKIDLGSEYTDSENTIENPFFEPLANGIDLQISSIPILTGTYTGEPSSNYLPFMWESGGSIDSYPDVGFDYAPRIAIFIGAESVFVEPSLSGLDNDTICYYVYEDSNQISIPSISQIYPSSVGRDFAGVKQLIDKAIVYGNGINSDVQDLWELIYQKSVNQAYFTPSLEFLVNLSLLDFSNISFRRKWKLKYNSAAWGEIEIYARIARISDFLINGNIVTPVELLPDNNNFKDCTIQEDEFEIIFPDGNKFIEIDPAFGVNGGSPSDTDPIEIIEDKSGNGNDFEQPNATFRPKWKLDGISGIPSIDTTGIVSYLQLLSTSLGSDEISFWIVLKREGSPNGGSYGSPLVLSTNSYSGGGNFLQIHESLTANYTLNASVASLDKALTLTTNDPYIFSFVKTATGMEYFVNGVSVGTNVGSQSLTSLAHIIGAIAGNSFNGLIGYFLLYNEAVSTPKRENIDNLFSLKFGI